MAEELSSSSLPKTPVALGRHFTESPLLDTQYSLNTSFDDLSMALSTSRLNGTRDVLLVKCRDTIENLQEQIAEERQERRKAQAISQKLQHDADAMKLQLLQEEQKCQQLQHASEITEEQLRRTERKLKRLELEGNRSSELEQELEQAHAKIRTLEMDLRDKTVENENCTGQLHKMQRQIEEKERMFEENSKAVTALHDKLHTVETKNRLLTVTLDDAEIRCKTLQEECLLWKMKVQNGDSLLESMTSAQEKYQEQIVELERQQKEREREIERSYKIREQVLKNDLEKKSLSLEEEIRKLVQVEHFEEIKKTKTNYEVKLEELTRQLNQLHDEQAYKETSSKDELLNVIKELEIDLKAAKKELLLHQQESDELKRIIIEKQQDVSRFFETNKREIERYKKERFEKEQNLLVKNTENEREIKRLTKNLEENESRMKQLEETISEWRSKCIAAQSELNQVRTEVGKLRANDDIKQKTMELNRVTRELDLVQQMVARRERDTAVPVQDPRIKSAGVGSQVSRQHGVTNSTVSDRLTDILSEKDEEIKSLKSVVEQLKQEIQKSSQLLDVKQQEMLAENQRLHESIRELEAKIQHIEAYCQQFKAELEKTAIQKQKLEERCQMYEKEKLDLRLTAEKETKLFIAELEAKNSEIKSIRDRYEKTIADLQREVHIRTAEETLLRESIHDELRSVNQWKASLECKYKQMMEEVKSLNTNQTESERNVDSWRWSVLDRLKDVIERVEDRLLKANGLATSNGYSKPLQTSKTKTTRKR
eukprot:GILK01010829.1.p1 GENE.GILK01010829.1~~GILK01010829.1.p1  ORF type:complete len:769 (-),score=257.25 GILK01010829.1:63-2369(-)